MGLSEMIGSFFYRRKTEKNFGLISRNTDIDFLKKSKWK